MSGARLRTRQLKASDRRIIEGKDFWIVLELVLLATIATFLPEKWWERFSRRFETLKCRLGVFSTAPIERGLKLVRGPAASEEDAFNVAATRTEHHLQIVREWLWGWTAPIELVGSQHVEEALKLGNGVVLWVAHFSFNALATKKAFRAGGYLVSHLSRPEHGFSKSLFGIAMLNPIRVKAELRYLRDRIIIDRSKPASAVQRARQRLRANEIISITAGAWEGSQTATVAINAAEYDLSVGAPGLAYLSRAPLLPVYTFRRPGSLKIEVVVDEQIPVAGRSRDEAVGAAAQMFADRVAHYARVYPLQWRDWEKLRPPTTT